MRVIRAIAASAVLLAVLDSPPAESHKLGVFGGVNYGKLKFDPNPGPNVDNEWRPGPSAGVLAQFGEGVALRVSPMWAQKGGRQTVAGVEERTTLNYVDVPLLLVLMPPSGAMRPYFMGGPSLNFLLSARSQTDAGPKVDVEDQMEPSVVSARFGAGVVFTSGDTGLFFEGEYERGLQNIMKESAAGGADMRTNGLRMNAGIMFPFSHND